jgi:glucosamine-phosphate N-acetyltransferase
MSEYKISELSKNDYHLGFLELLEQLTSVDAKSISYDEFNDHFDKIKSNIFVVKYNEKIIATASLLIEPKFIHRLSSVGHIEDVVIDKNYRNNGLGKLLINHCVNYAKQNGCYKIILNCSSSNIGFYEKCGFINNNVEMAMYI